MLSKAPAILTPLFAVAIGCGGMASPKHAAYSGSAPSPDRAYAGDGEAYDSGGAAEEAPESVAGGAYVAQRGVAAGEWDDNANYREFQKFLQTHQGIRFDKANIENRQFIVVKDAQGQAVPSCSLTVTDAAQNTVRLMTMASGRAILFPEAEGVQGTEIGVTAACNGEVAATRATIKEGEGVIELKLLKNRALPQRRSIDIAFVLDSTGSMSEEIAAVKATIRTVAAGLDELGVDIRIGLVEYRDRTDHFVTRIYPLTSDIDAFAQSVSRIQAGGGGDMPESMNEGLSVALSKLKWNRNAVSRLTFVVADAPPHLDYQQDISYAVSMRLAARRGIQVHTIAASGMDLLGQVVMRQIAQYTGGTNMFVLRGGAGPQSTGGGDPETSCGGTHTNYTSGNLDGLILGKIRGALKSVDADPMRIAGLGKDERAKPCSERVIATD